MAVTIIPPPLTAQVLVRITTGQTYAVPATQGLIFLNHGILDGRVIINGTVKVM